MQITFDLDALCAISSPAAKESIDATGFEARCPRDSYTAWVRWTTTWSPRRGGDESHFRRRSTPSPLDSGPMIFATSSIGDVVIVGGVGHSYSVVGPADARLRRVDDVGRNAEFGQLSRSWHRQVL